MLTKEAAFLACLQGILSNPEIANLNAIKRLEDCWMERILEAADQISDRAVLRIPKEEPNGLPIRGDGLRRARCAI